MTIEMQDKLNEVEEVANAIFAMVDRVKNPSPTQAEVDEEVSKAIDMFNGTTTDLEDEF